MFTHAGVIASFLVSGLICLATAVVCPDSSQWNLRTKARCNSSLPSYNCLYDESTSTFVEFCTKNPDFQRPGYKFIIRGNIDGIECDTNRFQPIKFWTNGSNDCILEKTGCNEKGQVIHDEGSSMSDRTCRCDYTRGFAFVTSPKQNCFCNPSLDDCSCFMKPCSKFKVMTPDYNCIDASEWTGIFKCPVITKTMTTSATTKCPAQRADITRSPIMAMVVKKSNALTVTILIVTTVFLIIVFTTCGRNIEKCCRNINMTEETLEQFTQRIIKVRSKMTLKVQATNYKDIITQINTMEIVNKLTLITSSEKNSIDICQGRRQKNKALLKIVWKNPPLYNEFTEAIIQSASHKQLQHKIQDVTDFRKEYIHNGTIQKNGKVPTDSQVQEQLDKQLYNEKIPDDVRNVFETFFNNWYKDHDKFTVTSVTRMIESELKKTNCVLVVGRSGNGKSAILRHLALKLYNEEGYDVIPIVLDPSTILQYHDPGKKQLFIIDVFCGKVVTNAQTVQMWSLKIHDILQLIKENPEISGQTLEQGPVKLLFATQPFVCEYSSFSRVGLSKYTFNLNDHQLNPNDKMNMIKKYLPLLNEDLLIGPTKCDKTIFPLLCKLSEGLTTEQIIQLFQNHHNIIKQDFQALKQTNKKQMCVIALCALLDSLTDDIFCIENTPCNNEIIEEVCSEFDLDFSKSSIRAKLQEELEHLEKTYFAKSDDSYYFEHKEIYDIAVLFCGEIAKKSFIKFSSSPFIAERYSFEKTNEEESTNLIFIVGEDIQKTYFDRLMSDLAKGVTYSTFHNSQLRNESYVDKFCKYCILRKPKIVELLSRLGRQSAEPFEHGYGETKEKKKECHYEYADYIDFSSSCNFSSHKMKIPLIESAWEGNVDVVNLLIKMERDVNETDKFGRTALFVACYIGKAHVAKEPLENLADPAFGNAHKISPLDTAFEDRHTQIVQTLLKNGAKPFTCDSRCWSPLIVASAKGNEEIVGILLSVKSQILQCDKSGRSALMVASYYGKTSVVKLLIGSQANINECDRKGFTSLMTACSEGHLGVVKVLLQNNASMSEVDFDGRSALYIACKKGKDAIVDILLKKKAEFDKCDWHEQSPLFIASALGHDKIVSLLVDKDCNISQSDEEGKSPLFIACEKGHTLVVDILLKVCTKLELLQIDKKRRTPLYIACRAGFLTIVKQLVEKKANINQHNMWKETPLFAASREGHADVVEYLIEKNADLNAEDENKNTPLLVACNEENTDVVKILVQKGSDQLKFDQMIRHINKERKSALFIAREKGNNAIDDILLKNCTPEDLKLLEEEYNISVASIKDLKELQPN